MDYKNDASYKDDYKKDCKEEHKEYYKEEPREEYKGEHNDKCKCKDGCDKECSIYTGISVPVELEPDVDVGDLETVCSGDPVVKGECCEGDTLKFVITQHVIVKIPVCFKVKAKHGKCKADCKRS